MKRYYLTALLSLPLFLLSPAHASRDLAYRSMEVSVVDAETGERIPDGIVNYYREDYTAGESGPIQVPLKIRSHGTYINVRADGYTPRRVRWRHTDPDLYPESYTVKMSRGISISGRVVNEEDEPVSGAVVHVLGTGSDMAEDMRPFEDKPYVYDETVRTDADGHWRYPAFPVDRERVSLRIEHPDYLNDDRFGGETPLSDYISGKAVRVLKRGRVIRGTVSDRSGDAVVGAGVFSGGNRFGAHYPEAESGLGGYFVIPQNEDAEQVLTFIKPGFAPRLMVVGPNEIDDQVSVVLEEGHNVALTIVDPDGNPVENAWVTPDSWYEKPGGGRYRSLADVSRFTHNAGVLKYNKRTDAAGVFRWTWAPEEPVKYSVGKEGYMYRRDVELSARDNNQTVTLFPALKVSGRVVDEQTGESIPDFRVMYTMSDDDQVSRFYDRYAVRGKDGAYEVVFDEMASNYWVKIDALGYEPVVSRPVNIREGQASLDFSLERGTTVTLRVEDQEGRPVKGAQIQIAEGHRPNFMVGGPSHQPRMTTGADGTLTFNRPTGPYTILALADEGTGMLSGGDIDSGSVLRIDAYASVEVTVFDTNGVPRADLPLMIGSENVTHMMNHDIRTDQQGIARFTEVMPGLVHVGFGREERDQNGNIVSVSFGNLQPLFLKPGEAARVMYDY